MEITWSDFDYSFRIAYNRYKWVTGEWNFVAVAAAPDDEVLDVVPLLEGGDDESLEAAHIIFATTATHFVAIGDSPAEALQNLQNKILEGKHG